MITPAEEDDHNSEAMNYKMKMFPVSANQEKRPNYVRRIHSDPTETGR